MKDLTVEILTKIHDQMTGFRSDLGELREDFNQRLDQTNQRLDGANVRLERVERGLLDLGKSMRKIARDQARHERFRLQHVEVLEADVADLKGRVRRVEDQLAGR